MDLISEKLHDLYNREDEIKKLIEKNNKKIDLLDDKLVKLNDAKSTIERYFSIGVACDIIGALADTGIEELFITLAESKKRRELKKKRTRIIKMMLVVIKLKKEYKNEIQSLENELDDVKEQIRNI